VTAQRLTFGGITLEAAPGWKNITGELEEPNPPFTLAKSDGVGALQLSPALYRHGPIPAPTTDDLLEMAEKFGSQRNLGHPFDQGAHQGAISSAGVSYHSRDDFIRAWYVTDGRNFALITYVCKWGLETEELAECEEMIKGIQFADASIMT
jgi:hypothetical protein